MAQDRYEPGERRPIASRNLKASQAIAAWLAARGASPNGISVAGVVVSALAGLAFWSTAAYPDFNRLAWLTGAVCVQLRLQANMFDGMVAIASGKASRLGELFNEAPDRFSDAFMLIGLGYAAASDPTLGYLAALGAVLTAYVRALGKVAGAPQDYCGPMAKQHRALMVTILAVYMGLAPTAWRPIEWRLPALALAMIFVGTLVTTARRLWRAARYLQGS